MERLKVELLPALLRNNRRIWTQSGCSNCLCIVVIVLLAFDERLHVDREDDLRLKAQLAQRPTDKMVASQPIRHMHAAAQPNWATSDCEEKRDPDEKQRSH